MKTAISIPDDVFAEAERLTLRLQKSRSQLYTEALQEYLARHDPDPDTMTDEINRACDLINEQLDPAVEWAGIQLLQKVRLHQYDDATPTPHHRQGQHSWGRTMHGLSPRAWG